MQTSMKSPRYEQHITCLPNCLWCIEAHQPPKYHITFSKADHDRHRGECCFQALIQSCLENATCMVHTSCDRASMRACLLYMAQPLLQKPADYGRPCMYQVCMHGCGQLQSARREWEGALSPEEDARPNFAACTMEHLGREGAWQVTQGSGIYSCSCITCQGQGFVISCGTETCLHCLFLSVAPRQTHEVVHMKLPQLQNCLYRHTGQETYVCTIYIVILQLHCHVSDLPCQSMLTIAPCKACFALALPHEAPSSKC